MAPSEPWALSDLRRDRAGAIWSTPAPNGGQSVETAIHSSDGAAPAGEDVRHDWTAAEAQALYQAPFNDLLFQAHLQHRRNFDPNAVQKSRLLSIKTGGCPEDCGYCSQSARYNTGVGATKLLDAAHVVGEARHAQAAGATRYCMGAAWR